MRLPEFHKGALLLLASACLCSLSMDSRALLIDDFSTAQGVSALDPQATDDDQVMGVGILGLERDLEVTRTSGFLVTMGTSSGRLVYGQVGGGVGVGRIVWDGTDADAALDPSGLGGVDLTDGGVSSAFAIYLSLVDVSIDLVLTVYTDVANWSTVTVPVSGGIPPSSTLPIGFADFAVAGGSGADFTNVGAAELVIDGSGLSSANVEIDEIRTVPEPATALTLGLELLVLGWWRTRGGVGQRGRRRPSRGPGFPPGSRSGRDRKHCGFRASA